MLIVWHMSPVLEGEYVTPQDAEDLSNRAAFYAVVYAIASLFLGLLFKASPEELRKRATLVEANQQGGSGTILGTFCFIILSITTLVLDDLTDQNVLEQTYSWLYALPHSKHTGDSSYMAYSNLIWLQVRTSNPAFGC